MECRNQLFAERAAFVRESISDHPAALDYARRALDAGLGPALKAAIHRLIEDLSARLLRRKVEATI
jgi:hypothetical protein